MIINPRRTVGAVLEIKEGWTGLLGTIPNLVSLAHLLEMYGSSARLPPSFAQEFIDFWALPDIDSFYREWLGRPLPDEKDFRDMTYEVTKGWGK